MGDMQIRPFTSADTETVVALWERCGLTRGLGSALPGHAEGLLMAMGCPKVQLQVRPENHRALDFYTANGFEAYDSVSAGKRLIPDN